MTWVHPDPYDPVLTLALLPPSIPRYVGARKAFVFKKGTNGFKASASPVCPLVHHLIPLVVDKQDMPLSSVVPKGSSAEETAIVTVLSRSGTKFFRTLCQDYSAGEE